MKGETDTRISNAPTIFVIFGGTGNLFHRKIVPALFDLFRRGLLPEKFALVGVARRELTDEAFKQTLRNILIQKQGSQSEKIEEFLASAHYHQGLFDEPQTYSRLKIALDAIDTRLGQCSNKLFHLAVPPLLYDLILTNLHQSKLSVPCSDDLGWIPLEATWPLGLNTANGKDRKTEKPLTG